jgi:hypothetical protein
MNAPSWDIKDMLEAYEESSASTSNDLGLEYGVNLFTGQQPPKPYDSVTIFDTPGLAPWVGLDGSTGYDYPAIQILVRNKDYNEGFDIIERIKEVLHGRAQETWNATLYSRIACSTPPALLEWDDNGCACFVINFNLQRRPSA